MVFTETSGDDLVPPLGEGRQWPESRRDGRHRRRRNTAHRSHRGATLVKSRYARPDGRTLRFVNEAGAQLAAGWRGAIGQAAGARS
jgi:hypothetical protein